MTQPIILGPRTLQALAVIVGNHARRRPTAIPQLSAALGLTHRSSAQCHVNRLLQLGLITRQQGTQATIVPACTIEWLNKE